MSKAKKITAITFGCLFAIIGCFILFWFFGDNYKEFYSISTKEFAIAGLNEGFVPQGICYNQENDIFLTSGYMKNGSASRIYVIDASTNKTTKYFTLKDGTEDYFGHAGGIDTNGEKVWVAGDKKVVVFNFDDIATVENKSSITISDSFSSNNGADFVTVDGNNLWIGEFHKEGKYDTDQSHQIETPNGANNAISFCYDIDNTQTLGIKSTTPTKALSTRSLVQGMAIIGDKILLSTSYSLPKSHIYIYDNLLNNSTTTEFDYNGTEIPLYILNEHIEEISAPCMSEELTTKGDRVYLLFESACKKYNLVTREQLKNVYSFKIN